MPSSANHRNKNVYNARADVHARGFWERRQDTFFDIRVFHPNVLHYYQTQIASLLEEA